MKICILINQLPFICIITIHKIVMTFINLNYTD